MQSVKRAALRKRVIGYMNIGAILLGITHLRVNFQEHRVDRTRYIHIYVLCANVATLALIPFAYVQQIVLVDAGYYHKLSIFTDCVNMFITFGAVMVSVVLRWKHEALYMDFAKAIFQLDTDYFGRLCIDNAVERRSDYLIFFKVLTFMLQAIAPFYGCIQFTPPSDWRGWLTGMFYGYVHNLLFGTLFIYFYLMWLLRKRFSLLNTKLQDLFCLLNAWSVSHGRTVVSPQKPSSAFATKGLMEMAKVHAQLSALTARLNEDFKVQILAGLLTQLINCISYSYFGISMHKGHFNITLDTQTTILCSAFTLLMFFDGYLLYWIAETTARTYRSTPQLLRRFQVLPVLDDDFERQSELFTLQLRHQNHEISIAGMFSLNLRASLAVLAFTFQQVLILMQFDYETSLQNSEESVVLDKFNKLLRFNSD